MLYFCSLIHVVFGIEFSDSCGQASTEGFLHCRSPLKTNLKQKIYISLKYLKSICISGSFMTSDGVSIWMASTLSVAECAPYVLMM